jgi:nicotinate-nucleotide adenylyltransferase
MNDQPRRVGILGGTFDPIHGGHIDVGVAAERALRLTQIFVTPSLVPPHRRHTFATVYHRFAMVALAVADHPTWRASDLELRGSGPSYTAATLHRFHGRGYVPAELFFIIGVDAFFDIAAWRDYPEILDWTHFVVVARPGYPIAALTERLPSLAARMVHPPLADGGQATTSIILIDAPTTDVSSTLIREHRAAGTPITGLVAPGVERHIEQHGLYTAATGGRRRSDGPAEMGADRLHGES